MALISGGILKLLSLVCSVISGMLFAFVWRNYEQTVIEVQNIHNFLPHLKDTHYDQWLKEKGIKRHPITEEFKSFRMNEKNLNSDIILESEYLYNKVKVLCLILCKSRKGALAVKVTWAKHCNHVIFFGPFVDHKIPVIKYPPSSSHCSFCHSFIKAWHKYSNQFDWLFIAYDETYAIIENLRHYVAPLNASNPFYFGRAVKHYFTGIYNSADSGIVLSKGAALIIKNVFYNESVCDKSFAEGIGTLSRNFEVSLAIILSHFGCNAVDTRDSQNRGRFHSFTPEKQLIPGMISIFNSYWRSSVFLPPEGGNCCSDLAITFNGIHPSAMYLTEYILHHMAIFGNSPLGLGNKPPPYNSYKVRSDFDKNILNEMDMIEMGTPQIHVMDNSKNKNKIQKHSKKFGVISNFLYDFFGN